MGDPRYDLANWYWTVGGDESRAYSSAVNDYVPADDPAFVAFKNAGSVPTAIDSEYSLGQVLGPLPLDTHTPIPADIRAGYYAAKEDEHALWLDHEDRIRVIETQLGLRDPPPLPSADERLAALTAAIRRRRQQR